MAWKKGQSGNPGGRPKALRDFTEKCRARTGKALNALSAALKDEKSRVQAASVLLAYGWGKPSECEADLTEVPLERLVAEVERRYAESRNGPAQAPGDSTPHHA